MSHEVDYERLMAIVLPHVLPRLTVFMLLSLRSTTAFVVSPWPGSAVPARIRVVLAMLLAALGAAALPVQPPVGDRALIQAALAELVYGGAIGIGLWAAQAALLAAGQLAGQAMGLGLASSFDPHTESQVSTTSQLAAAAWAPMAIALGLHSEVIRTLYSAPLIVEGADLYEKVTVIGAAAIASTPKAFVLAVSASGPVIALTLIGYAALGAVARAVPNITILGEALAALALLGLLAFAASVMAWPEVVSLSAAPFLEAIRGR